MNPSSRNLVISTLNFESPVRLPRQLWLLPWAEMRYAEWVKRIRDDFPDDIVQAPGLYRKPLPLVGGKYKAGEYIDEWGCKFINREEGVMGIVHEPLIQSWDDLHQFKAPEGTLDLDVEGINQFCRSTEKFVYAGSIVRPFERFQFLRTMETSFMDVIMEEEGYLELIGRLHEHFCKEVEAWSKTEVDAIFLMDDWGTQYSMMVDPSVFRKHFKPMYRDYCEIAKQHGKFVFMHSDGNILEILPDLIEVGIDAINSQVFCMGLDKLSEVGKGKITFWGEIDRQNILPNANPDEIRWAVEQVFHYLYDQGGVIAQCEFGPGAKPENVYTVFDQWNRIL